MSLMWEFKEKLSLRRRSPGEPRREEKERRALREEPTPLATPPNYDLSRRRGERWEDVNAALLLTIGALIFIVAGLVGSPLIAMGAIIVGVALTFLQPMIGYERWPTGYGVARALSGKGLLEEWAILGPRVPIVARLRSGHHLAVKLELFGLKATVIVTSTAGHVTLPVGRAKLARVKIKRHGPLGSESLRMPEDLGRIVRARASVWLAEALMPSLRSPRLSMYYRGKVVLVDLLAKFSLEYKRLDEALLIATERALELLYEPLKPSILRSRESLRTRLARKLREVAKTSQALAGRRAWALSRRGSSERSRRRSS